MKDIRRHLPFALVLYLVGVLISVALPARLDASILATLLAPIFWLGMYGLIAPARGMEKKR